MRRTVSLLALAPLALLTLACGGSSRTPAPIPVPAGLTYGTNPAVYTVGKAIEANRPQLAAGTAQTWAVQPPLPAGLALDPATGAITGTPAALTAKGAYTLSAGNASGTATAVLTLTVNPAPPVIEAAPASQTAGLGLPATFKVVATGTGTLSYQWQKNRVDLAGATQASLTIPAVTRGDEGSAYRVIVADPYGGTTTSPEATLGVLAGGLSALTDLVQGRYGHEAVLLRDGQVLVLGGRGGAGVVASAERVDPATGRATPTPGAPLHPRFAGTATVLPDGRVLLAGGWNPAGLVATAELFDPVTGTFSAAGNLKRARMYHTATLLPGGQVLVAGGQDGVALASAELFDPATRSFRPVLGTLGAARAFHAAVPLNDGRVLLAGGLGTGALASCEVYDPATESFRPAASLGEARYLASATVLTDGSVLLAGGRGTKGSLGTAERFADGAFRAVGKLGAARQLHTATLLPDGTVLLSGGWDGASALGTFEVFDPTRNAFQPVSGALVGFHSHTAVRLSDGSVLVLGGFNIAPLGTVGRWTK